MSIERHFDPNRPPTPKKGWRRFRQGVVCLLLLLALSHVWWLRAVGDYLIADAPVTHADAAVILGGDHRLQRAADLFRERAVGEVWVIEREPSYAVSAGMLPPGHEVEMEELTQLGVPADRLRVVRGEMRDIDDAARMIVSALEKSPETSVVILCRRLDGRNVGLVTKSVMPQTPRLHIHVLGIPSDEFDENNWWKSRTGWKETFTAASQLLFTVLCGVNAGTHEFDWDPDVYEQDVINRYRDTECHSRD